LAKFNCMGQILLWVVNGLRKQKETRAPQVSSSSLVRQLLLNMQPTEAEQTANEKDEKVPCSRHLS